MRQHYLLLIVIASFFFSTNSSSAKSPNKSDTVCVYGEIRDFHQKKNSMVTFFVNDYVLCRQLSYYSTIDSSGKFSLKFPVRNTQDIFWRYNEDSLLRLIVSPRDSLAIVVSKTEIYFSGSNAKVNEDMNSLWPLYVKQFPSRAEERAVARLEPEEYILFRKQIREKQIKLLDSFFIEKKCSALFKQWYLTNSEVNYFNELLAYVWKSLKYGVGSSARLSRERKEKYVASFMNNEEGENEPHAFKTGTTGGFINLKDDRYALSSQFMSLINNLSHQYIRMGVLTDTYLKDKVNYLLDHQNELSIKEVSLLNYILKFCKTERDMDSLKQKEYYSIAYRYKDQLSLKMQKRWIDWQFSEAEKIRNPNIRDLILCQSFCNYIATNYNADYYYKSIAAKISNSKYLKAITEEYDELKTANAATNELLTSEFKGVQITKPNNEETGDQLLNSILLANKNKVIFIDLWATWCGPCRADFNKMSPLKSTYPFDSVRFVYLSCRSKESEWINTIKKYDLKGMHYLITDAQYASLEKRFKIKGFPTYLIIDKQRKLHKDITLVDMKALADKIDELTSKR